MFSFSTGIDTNRNGPFCSCLCCTDRILRIAGLIGLGYIAKTNGQGLCTGSLCILSNGYGNCFIRVICLGVLANCNRILVACRATQCGEGVLARSIGADAEGGGCFAGSGAALTEGGGVITGSS